MASREQGSKEARRREERARGIGCRHKSAAEAMKPPSRLLARRPRMSACGISIFQHGRHHDYPDIERAGRPDIERAYSSVARFV